MDAIFIELPPFARHRAAYLSDASFRSLQNLILLCPTCGDVIQQTGGLRQLSVGDLHRHKGKRAGLRVMYYWWQDKAQVLLFTVYAKSEMDDLSCLQRDALRGLLEQHTQDDNNHEKT